MLVSICTFAVGLVIGYKFSSLEKAVRQLQMDIKVKLDKKPEPVGPQSRIVDPLDPIQQIEESQRKLMERLNS